MHSGYCMYECFLCPAKLPTHFPRIFFNAINQPFPVKKSLTVLDITTNEDGSPLVVLYPRDAPSNIATDPFFEHEIQKFRAFTDRWKGGQKVKISTHNIRSDADTTCEYSHASDRILSQTYHLSVSLFACKHIICPCAWTLASSASRSILAVPNPRR